MAKSGGRGKNDPTGEADALLVAARREIDGSGKAGKRRVARLDRLERKIKRATREEDKRRRQLEEAVRVLAELASEVSALVASNGLTEHGPARASEEAVEAKATSRTRRRSSAGTSGRDPEAATQSPSARRRASTSTPTKGAGGADGAPARRTRSPRPSAGGPAGDGQGPRTRRSLRDGASGDGGPGS